MATTVNVQELLDWFEDPTNRCYFNNDLLAVRPSAISSGVGVFAKKTQSPVPAESDVDESNLLLRVHKSMVLSPQTSTISNLLYEHGLSGMYGLVLSFIYEKQLGDKSPWSVYLNTINYTDSKGNLILPLCLHSEKEKSILRGTEVELMGGLESDDLLAHFEVSCQFAKDVNKDTGLPIPHALREENFNEFAAVTMAVASRAFEVDNYIELALVPGADLFNHDAHGEENVHFVTLGEVCPYCGKEDGCWHGDYGPPDSEEEGDDDEEDDDEERDRENYTHPRGEEENSNESDESEIEEIEEIEEITMDYIEKLERELEEEKTREDEEDKEDESSIEDNGDDSEEFDHNEFFMNPDECCDIVLEKKIIKNKEVYNTYGELPNAILLVKYGFAVEDNAYETVCVGPQIVQFRKANPDTEERLDWWSCMGWILLREEEKNESKEEDEEDDDDEDSEEEDEDEDEDEEESWLFQCKVEYPGRINSQLRAVASLLTMTTENFEKLIGDENCDGEMIMNELVKKKPSKECKKLLKAWIQERHAAIGDQKTRSGELKRQLKKTDPHSTRFRLVTAVISEKKLLENALHTIK